MKLDKQEHRNTFQVNLEDQKEEASSRLNNIPPTGAPNAAATPAAAPPDTKSLLSWSATFYNIKNYKFYFVKLLNIEENCCFEEFLF